MVGMRDLKRIERIEREERKETRIERDVKTFVGWSYIEKIVEQSDHPELVVGIFLTGGRASEILDLTGGMFTEFEDYYEVVGMPVYKRYDVVEKYIDTFGKRRWKTQLVMERRTFPIMKDETFSDLLWEYAQKNEGRMYEFKDRRGRLWKDQYWQLYKRIHNLKAPRNPYAPEKLYPHWLRGQRAAQLRVEYNLDIDKLMRFFGWKSFEMAQHYAGMSSRDIAEAIMIGKVKRKKILKTDVTREENIQQPLSPVTKQVDVLSWKSKEEKVEDEIERIVGSD